MQKWEYLTEFFSAYFKNEGWEEYRQEHIPNFKQGKFSPETMIPRFNRMGEDGWELVHMQPVVVGPDDDVVAGGSDSSSSNAYFCAWKRPKQEAIEDEQEMRPE